MIIGMLVEYDDIVNNELAIQKFEYIYRNTLYPQELIENVKVRIIKDLLSQGIVVNFIKEIELELCWR